MKSNKIPSRLIKGLISMLFIIMLPTQQLMAQWWYVFKTSNSGLSSNNINSLTLDANGMWIGTAGGGLCNYAGTTWTVYNTSNSQLPGNDVRSVAVDGLGNKWIGTYGHGLAKFDGVNWTIYDNNTTGGILDNYISSVVVDGANVVLVGTFGAGMFRFDGSSWINYTLANSDIPSDYIYSIRIDQFGNLWLGTGQGLAKANQSGWTVYNTSNSGIANNIVRSITIDGNDVKWIGTDVGGLCRFDNTNWTIYNTSNSGIQYNFITGLAIDYSGNLWVGATNYGISQFDGLSGWTVYNTSNSGLPDNSITSVVVDGGNNKWIGTPTGLAYYGSYNADVSVQENLVNNDLTIYPNPTSSDIYITTPRPGIAEDMLLEVYTTAGKKMLSGNITRDQPVSVESLAKGMYILTVTIEEKVFRKKLLVD